MSSIAKILAPVDFSPPSEGAVRLAQALIAPLGCNLTLLHVLEPTEFQYSPIQIPPERLDELLTGASRKAREQLERFPENETGCPNTHRMVLKGDPAEQILLCAHSDAFDLIVMPTHGYDPIRRFLLGSVTSKVLYGADVPVLTGVHFEKYTTGAFRPRHIVCGLDCGPHSARVLEWATELAESLGAELTVVHSTPEIGGSTGDLHHPDWQVQAHQRLREQIATLQSKADKKAEVVIASGEPHKALRDAVLRLNADLLVIGRGSAEGPWGRLRAHAYAIIRASPCPVVSV